MDFPMGSAPLRVLSTRWRASLWARCSAPPAWHLGVKDHGQCLQEIFRTYTQSIYVCIIYVCVYICIIYIYIHMNDILINTCIYTYIYSRSFIHIYIYHIISYYRHTIGFIIIYLEYVHHCTSTWSFSGASLAIQRQHLGRWPMAQPDSKSPNLCHRVELSKVRFPKNMGVLQYSQYS